MIAILFCLAFCLYFGRKANHFHDSENKPAHRFSVLIVHIWLAAIVICLAIYFK